MHRRCCCKLHAAAWFNANVASAHTHLSACSFYAQALLLRANMLQHDFMQKGQGGEDVMLPGFRCAKDSGYLNLNMRQELYTEK